MDVLEANYTHSLHLLYAELLYVSLTVWESCTDAYGNLGLVCQIISLTAILLCEIEASQFETISNLRLQMKLIHVDYRWLQRVSRVNEVNVSNVVVLEQFILEWFHQQKCFDVSTRCERGGCMTDHIKITVHCWIGIITPSNLPVLPWGTRKIPDTVTLHGHRPQSQIYNAAENNAWIGMLHLVSLPYQPDLSGERETLLCIYLSQSLPSNLKCPTGFSHKVQKVLFCSAV